MKKIGITGHNGFIGYHLYTYIKYFEKEYEPLKLSTNLQSSKLAEDFGNDCDIIIHLGEKNKNNKGLSDEVIYENNRNSTKTLIDNLQKRGKKNMKLFYASSTHEDDDSLYGKYRRENKKDFQDWAERTESTFNWFRIPNVFGPFCRPNYNSFIATFCHKIINNEEVDLIENGTDIPIIYVDNLCDQIMSFVEETPSQKGLTIMPDVSVTVTDIYQRLRMYKSVYIDQQIIPMLANINDSNLFNTFRSYISDKDRVVTTKMFNDDRGSLGETIKTLHQGQSFFSTTNPGQVRGNHFHIRKLERFCVLRGKAKIDLRKLNTDEVISYVLDGDKTQYIDMPLYYVHNITPADDNEIVVLFWTNELLNESDTDTYHELV